MSSGTRSRRVRSSSVGRCSPSGCCGRRRTASTGAAAAVKAQIRLVGWILQVLKPGSDGACSPVEFRCQLGGWSVTCSPQTPVSLFRPKSRHRHLVQADSKQNASYCFSRGLPTFSQFILGDFRTSTARRRLQSVSFFMAPFFNLRLVRFAESSRKIVE